MSNTGILLIHGFAGNVEEVKPLQDYLAEKGCLVKCPLLPGHGKTKKELAGSDYSEWIAAAEQAYLDLSKQCRKIIVIGFSMGGLLAVNLWNYGFAALITVNTPVYYWNSKIIASNLITNFGVYWKKYTRVSMDKSFSSMIEFQKLLTRTKPMFGNITCRTMVIQAMDDDTVHYKSADYIFDKVRAGKSIYKVPVGGHMLFQSESSKEICTVIENFIRSL